MRTSSDHILTSHAGSLPRPDDLIEAWRAADERALAEKLTASVADIVRRQKDLGIDVPGDGEFGKPMAQRVNYGSWWRYSWNRLGGLDPHGPSLYEMEPRRSSPGHVVLTSFGDRRDRTRFAAAYGDPESGITTGPRPPAPICVAPIHYSGHDAIQKDIANFKAALQAAGVDEGLYDRCRPGQRRADRQFILQDGGGTALRLRRCDARGIQGDPRRRPRPPARRSGDRRELGHDQSGADRRGVQEILDGPGRGAQPRDPRPASGPHPLPFVLGQLAWAACNRHRDARHRRCHAGGQRPCLFVRGRQCPPRARVEGLAGRQVARRESDSARCGQPRHQCRRAPRARRRAHSSLCEPGRPGAGHRLDRLRSRRPRPPDIAWAKLDALAHGAALATRQLWR